MPNKMTARTVIMQAEEDAKKRLANGSSILQSPPPAISDSKEEATVYVYDAIGSWFGIDPASWVPAFNAIKAKNIHLRINSPGGSVFDAEAIYNAIREHPSFVTAHIDGLCASAATTIALASDEIEMSEGSMFMIHNSWSCAIGNSRDFLKEAQLLDKVDETIVSRYVQKTGQRKDNIQNMMIAETWLTAAEALEYGFVDRIFTAAEPEEADDAENAMATVAPGVNVANGDADKARRERALLLAEIGM